MNHTLSSATEMSKDFGTGTHIYHIYQSGKKEVASYSIHFTSDLNTVLLEPPITNPSPDSNIDPISPSKKKKKNKPPLNIPNPNLATKIRRAKLYDRPDHDPRTETSPYFLHLPALAFHCPPYTLRHGGKRSAPVTALVKPSVFWGSWKLEFGDVLAQEDVIDPRGVVSPHVGTKKGEDGTLKGYHLRKFRVWGETGKAWFRAQQAEGKVDIRPLQTSDGAVRPDEVVMLKWLKPFSLHAREYGFSWRGFEFRWKGTTQVTTTRDWRRYFVVFNHLKLVVLVPSPTNNNEGEKPEQLTLARYTSVLAARKMGRLELDHEAIDHFLSQYIAGRDQVNFDTRSEFKMGEKEKVATRGIDIDVMVTEKTKQRLNDVIMGTGLSMLIGEWQKRKMLFDILLLILTEGAGS